MRLPATALLALLCSCSRPTKAECDSMLDRYLDMTEDDDPALTGLTGEPRASVRSERLEERRTTDAYREAERRCAAEVPKNAWECAMKAPTPNDWEACLTP